MEPNNTTLPDVEQEVDLAVGPGTLTALPDAQPSLLDGVTEYEWVDLYNPLPVPFEARVATSRPAKMPVRVYQTPGLQSGVRDESDLATQYGLTGFKNPDHPSNIHVAHTVRLEPNRIRRVAGNEAQVVLRQLVGYLLQSENKGLKLADPYERNLAEQRIIRGRGLVSDLYDEQTVSVRDQLDRSIEKSNKEMNHDEAEAEFPDATRTDRGADHNGANQTRQFEERDPNSPKV